MNNLSLDKVNSILKNKNSNENKTVLLKTTNTTSRCTYRGCGWKINFPESIKNAEIKFNKVVDKIYRSNNSYLTMDILQNGKSILSKYTSTFQQNSCNDVRDDSSLPQYKLMGIDIVSPPIHHINFSDKARSMEMIYKFAFENKNKQIIIHRLCVLFTEEQSECVENNYLFVNNNSRENIDFCNFNKQNIDPSRIDPSSIMTQAFFCKVLNDNNKENIPNSVNKSKIIKCNDFSLSDLIPTLRSFYTYNSDSTCSSGSFLNTIVFSNKLNVSKKFLKSFINNILTLPKYNTIMNSSNEINTIPESDISFYEQSEQELVDDYNKYINGKFAYQWECSLKPAHKIKKKSKKRKSKTIKEGFAGMSDDEDEADDEMKDDWSDLEGDVENKASKMSKKATNLKKDIEGSDKSTDDSTDESNEESKDIDATTYNRLFLSIFLPYIIGIIILYNDLGISFFQFNTELIFGPFMSNQEFKSDSWWTFIITFIILVIYLISFISGDTGLCIASLFSVPILAIGFIIKLWKYLGSIGASFSRKLFTILSNFLISVFLYYIIKNYTKDYLKLIIGGIIFLGIGQIFIQFWYPRVVKEEPGNTKQQGSIETPSYLLSKEAINLKHTGSVGSVPEGQSPFTPNSTQTELTVSGSGTVAGTVAGLAAATSDPSTSVPDAATVPDTDNGHDATDVPDAATSDPSTSVPDASGTSVESGPSAASAPGQVVQVNELENKMILARNIAAETLNI